MKTCPNCGSILADNEPYCDNCGFNPDFDVGSWNDGYGRTNKKPYYHGDHIKDPHPYFINKEFDWIVFAIAFAVLIFVILMPLL